MNKRCKENGLREEEKEHVVVWQRETELMQWVY